MANQFTRAEKGKWTVNSRKSSRRSPIGIPECDSTSLIEDNKLTLIGRVTNPVVQAPKAVVENLVQIASSSGSRKKKIYKLSLIKLLTITKMDAPFTALGTCGFYSISVTNLLLDKDSWHPTSLLDKSDFEDNRQGVGKGERQR